MDNLPWNTFMYDNTQQTNFDGADYVVFYPQKRFVRFDLSYIIFGNPYTQIIKRALIFAYLNPSQSNETLKQIIIAINCKCQTTLSDSKIYEIYKEVLILKKDPQLLQIIQAAKPNAKEYRAFVLNPNVPQEQRNKIQGIARGQYRKKKAIEQIRNVINNWRVQWGKPTAKKIASKSKMRERKVASYLPLLKKEKQKATSLIVPKKKNKTFKLLWKTLIEWDLTNGVPTNKDLEKVTGIGLSTIEVYSPQFKKLKKKLREILKNKDDKRTSFTSYFAPFDDKNFVLQENDKNEKVVIDYINEIILDAQIEFFEIV